MADNVVWHPQRVSPGERARQKNQRPRLLWFTGLPGAGKSTLACALDERLFGLGYHTCLLDGDNMRHGLSRDLDFSDKDRVENIRRVGEVARLMMEAGLITIAAFISPFHAERNMVRTLLEPGEFIEIYVNAALDVCEARDPKGHYRRARQGQIRHFTGIDSPYEAPVDPEMEVCTDRLGVTECVDIIMRHLESIGALARPGPA